MSSETKEQEIACSRTINAPRTHFWEIWKRPDRFRAWWLPPGCVSPFHSAPERQRSWLPLGSGLRSGPDREERVVVVAETPARFSVEHSFDHSEGPTFVARSTSIEGLDRQMKVTLQVSSGAAPGLTFGYIDKIVRIEYEHTAPPIFRSVISLEDLNDRTKISFRAHFPSAREFAQVRDLAYQGLERTFDQIELELVQRAGLEPPKDLVLERDFDAPRELVWRYWTDPALLSKWWTAKGAPISKAKMDFRRGGAFQFCLEGRDGTESWAKLSFRDIVAPERLIWVNSLCDADGKVVRRLPEFPIEILSTARLEEKPGKGTGLSLSFRPVNALQNEVRIFNHDDFGFRRGWQEALGRLAEALRIHREGRWAPQPIQKPMDLSLE